MEGKEEEILSLESELIDKCIDSFVRKDKGFSIMADRIQELKYSQKEVLISGNFKEPPFKCSPIMRSKFLMLMLRFRAFYPAIVSGMSNNIDFSLLEFLWNSKVDIRELLEKKEPDLQVVLKKLNLSSTDEEIFRNILIAGKEMQDEFETKEEKEVKESDWKAKSFISSLLQDIKDNTSMKKLAGFTLYALMGIEFAAHFLPPLSDNLFALIKSAKGAISLSELMKLNPISKICEVTSMCGEGSIFEKMNLTFKSWYEYTQTYWTELRELRNLPDYDKKVGKYVNAIILGSWTVAIGNIAEIVTTVGLLNQAKEELGEYKTRIQLIKEEATKVAAALSSFQFSPEKMTFLQGCHKRLLKLKYQLNTIITDLSNRIRTSRYKQYSHGARACVSLGLMIGAGISAICSKGGWQTGFAVLGSGLNAAAFGGDIYSIVKLQDYIEQLRETQKEAMKVMEEIDSLLTSTQIIIEDLKTGAPLATERIIEAESTAS